MISEYAHDGAVYDETLVSLQKFQLNNKKDIKEVPVFDPVTGEKTDKREIIFNFVGFISNEKDDMLVVLPKHYRKEDLFKDSQIVFKCIAKHMQRRPELYMGDHNEDIYTSNFPFAAFFEIYDYYKSYGLYFEEQVFIKPNVGGRISWKDVIGKSDKYVIGGNLIMTPLYYRKKYHFSNFITECMIYAIDYTIAKFGIFLDIEEIGAGLPEVNLLEEKEYVLHILTQLRQQVFRDSVQRLLDNLIMFFSEVKIGGDFYLKHYSFSSIWEDMVKEYLCKFYKEVDGNCSVVFDKTAPKGLKFEKKTFYPNAAKSKQFISPDYYCEDGDKQLIFDAKYYSHIEGMDYKQIAYMYMLRTLKNSTTGMEKFKYTYNALILPSEMRSTKIHFQLDPMFGDPSNLTITEEYVDIKDVIQTYVEKV